MTFIMITAVELNKLVILIGHLPVRDSLTRPCLQWAVFQGKTSIYGRD